MLASGFVLPLYRFTLYRAVAFLLGVCAFGPAACAQLTLLSEGDTLGKWRTAQLETLQRQIDDANVAVELKAELQAQRKWLSAWKPKQLAAEPLWASRNEGKPLVEPVIDPGQRWQPLRERLLGETAQPTSQDTQELRQLLEEYPEDVGVRQLHLHWLDQTQYRKTYPEEIAAVALHLAALLERLPPSEEVGLARAFCWYRRGRALAYRELPDVLAAKPLADPAANDADLVGAYRQLKELMPGTHAEFVLLDVRMLRRDQWNGRALVLLEDFGKQVPKQWLLKKRRDILRELAWAGPAEEAAQLYAVEFPEQVDQE
jgi:hypothetical protein